MNERGSMDADALCPLMMEKVRQKWTETYRIGHFAAKMREGARKGGTEGERVVWLTCAGGGLTGGVPFSFYDLGARAERKK